MNPGTVVLIAYFCQSLMGGDLNVSASPDDPEVASCVKATRGCFGNADGGDDEGECLGEQAKLALKKRHRK